MTKGRLLIVSPTFHGYWRSIEDAFRQQGWDASTYRYDVLATVRQKLSAKLRSELPQKLGRTNSTTLATTQSRAAADAVTAAAPDRVLVIKGDVLDEQFWAALDRARIPRSLWLYDELRRTQHTRESLSRFDSIASYSHLDVEHLTADGYHASFVALAYDPSLDAHPRHNGDITFVGANYPKRLHLLQAIHDAGIRVRAYGRDWSRHPFDRARTWRLSSPEFPTARDLTRQQAYSVMAGAPATLNIHGDQDGFTMRTFEASGVGGVQFIDRTDVDEFYDPGTEVMPFSTVDELVELCRRAVSDDRWGDSLRQNARRRTLQHHTFVHRARQLEAAWA